jgi:hypothetical protein
MEVDWHASILFILQLIIVLKLDSFQNHMLQHIKHIRIIPQLELEAALAPT